MIFSRPPAALPAAIGAPAAPIVAQLPRVPRRNLNVTGFGPSGSGKSRTLADLWSCRADHLITLDMTGEGAERYPDATVTVYGLRDLLGAVRVCARSPRWHVIAFLEDEQIPELFGMLAPRLDGRRTSLAAALGGVTVECDEVDQIAPVNGAAPEVTSAWRRGRHHGLSLLAATQRPAGCARDVSAQAHVLFSMQASEPNDLEWVAKSWGSRAIAERVRELPQYHAAVYHRGTGRVLILDETRRPYRALTLAGVDAGVHMDG